jgi:hypothetical protein
MTNEPEREVEASEGESRRESGLPGGGQGRIDQVGLSGVYPGSGPWPAGAVEIRSPASFAHGQTDAEGRPIEGGSELIYFEGRTLLGGATPQSSSPAQARSKTEDGNGAMESETVARRTTQLAAIET